MSRRELLLEQVRKETLRLPVRKLKRCPLCGMVNAKINEDCFCCGWAGRFEYRESDVMQGIIEVIDRCPELVEVILPPRRKLLRRLKTAFRKLFARRRGNLDLRI